MYSTDTSTEGLVPDRLSRVMARVHAVSATERDNPHLPCNTGVKSKLLSTNLPVYVSAPDWFTLSATSASGVSQLNILASDLANRYVEEGDFPKEGRWLGYKGFTVGPHLFYGESKQGAILRASGYAADDVLHQLRQMGPLHFKATRVDIQTTLVYPELPDRGFFREIAEASHAAAESPDRKGRPWFVGLRDEFGRGDTVYVGARSSEAVGRVYDKHRENLNAEASEQYPRGSVRFELEQKGTQALQQLNELLKTDFVPGYVAGYIRGWYAARGVSVPLDISQVTQLSTIPRSHDIDRTLKWLRQSVAPAVQRVIGVGRRAEVLKALGLE